jgi:ABC-type glycerol-3-phosphate transport system substrate-binding protein
MGMVVEGEYFSRYLWGTGKPSNGIPFNYDMAMMPVNPTTGKRTNIYHGNGSFMTTQTKNADATWKWLKTIFTTEAQQIVTNFWGTRGAHKGTYESWLKTNGNGGPAGLNYEAILKSDGDTAPFPTTPYLTPQALLEPTTRLMYDQVFQNKTPVDQGIAQIDKETKAVLEKGKAELPK